ncbi:phage minor capsid protein [Alkalicoccobacillus gibsonii]|uniref:phage minor capsid protein n=1 Tax=Alkalicoccobacillus gibsonii TaxID=79881 RepID=UPI003F7B5414
MRPEDSQRLSQPITDIYLKVEEQILINIGKRLKRHRSLLTEEGYLSWELAKLSELQSLTQENIALIAMNSGMASNEVSRLLEGQGYKTITEVDKVMETAVKQGAVLVAPEGVGVDLRNVMNRYDNQLKSSLNRISSTMLTQSDQIYTTIINETVGLVAGGVYTPEQALRKVSSGWAEKGVPALVDSAGKQWSTEAYVNMVTRTTMNQLSNEVQLERSAEYGVDLVQISSHTGARPKCAPYQGKIFSRSGDHLSYPALSSTSYGELDGLTGINCRHVLYSFIEGVNIARPSNIDDAENDRIYKESQKQRYLERRIRLAKREMSMFEAMDDKEGVKAARRKITERQGVMRDFLKDTGRNRNRKREQIA